MSTEYGLKISKPGFDVKTAPPTGLVFSSQFGTPRIQQRGTGVIKQSTGRTATIPHNLGYVPKFLVHGDIPNQLSPGDWATLPYQWVAPFFDYYYNREAHSITCWADDTNLYIHVQDAFGYTFIPAIDYGLSSSLLGYWQNFAAIGESIPTWGDEDAALRFDSVPIAQGATIVAAEVGYYCSDVNGSGNVKCHLYGIDEDNTADFGSDPFGRSKTSAVSTIEFGTGRHNGDVARFNIKDQLQEVVNRGGWASGHNFGLFFIGDSLGDAGTEIVDGAADFGMSHIRYLLNDTLLNYKYTIFKDRIV